MRIGIDARFFGGEQSKGLGRYTQKLIAHLATSSSEHEYVVFLQQEAYDKWEIHNPKITPVLAPYHWYSIKEQLFMPWKIWRSRVDLMHFPHFNVPLLYWGRFVVTIHDIIIILFPTERATTLGPLLYTFKHWAGQMVMRHAVKRSSHIITVSEYSKKDIVGYYHVAPEKITVTYEAAENEHPPCTDEEMTAVKERYGIKKPYILYIGNAYPHKNLEVLLAALKGAKEEAEKKEKELPWQLVLVGKKDYFYARLKQDAWAKSIDSDVLFPGFVPDADLPCLYEGATAYVFPSRYEGFGLPALEAMLHHTPVLAANASCLPEILGDAALYFDPNDISGIIKAVERITTDAGLRAELRAKGEAQAKKYSWNTMMQQTHTVYDAQKNKQQK